MPILFATQNGSSNLHSFEIFISSQFLLYHDIHFSNPVKVLKDGGGGIYYIYSEYKIIRLVTVSNKICSVECSVSVSFKKSPFQTSTRNFISREVSGD